MVQSSSVRPITEAGAVDGDGPHHTALTYFDRQQQGAAAMNHYLDPTSTTIIAESQGKLLTVPTGVTNNEVVEPSILYDPGAPFAGYEYILCIAPYPASDQTKENPCLWVSHEGTTWIPIVYSGGTGTVTPGYGGTVTPVFAYQGQGDSTNSDPYIFRGPDGTYFIMWNQLLNSTGGGGTGTGSNNWGIKIMKSSSVLGPWSTPVSVLQSVLATIRPSSPSFFWDGALWHMYCVDLTSATSTSILHYTNTSADPTTGTWTKLTNPTIALPTGYTGQVWWHLNAYLVGGQHVLVVQDSKSGTSAGGHLWLLTSDDAGLTWTVPSQPFIYSPSSLGVYRAACVFTLDGAMDMFYGRLASVWELRRARISLNETNFTKYGGVTANGIPVNALAVTAAKIPAAPYVFGDVPTRADSAVTPGSADSGQAYTVSSGTVGISSKQLYAPSAGNNRAALTTTGCADGVTTGEYGAVETSTVAAWVICRFTDSSNYVRFGASANNAWKIENIVAGAVSQSVTIAGTPAAGDVFSCLHVGTKLTMYLNGKFLQDTGTTAWSSNSTASGVGVQFSGTLARIRNVTQRSLVGGA